jgi:crotonobetainyl-CoA:carnitine CoA-transferase CaiB-like acyl-CoA transferase
MFNEDTPPLKGIRVLDLSRVLAGPFCSMTLSDLGAEIIKVEIPGTGDDTRTFPPFINGVSSYYLSVNRGKKSITMDLKNPDAVEAFKRIASKSDVILENFRPGVTTRLGVDYESVKKVNPKIIYCSISSFGQTGPYAQWPGYDLVIQGMGGLMGITGEPNGPPIRVGVAVTDINAGLYAAIAIISALRVRDSTDIGQYIDLSMLDAGISWLTYQAGSYFATGNVPMRMGNAHPSIVPYQAFKASDERYLLIACGNDRLFGILCKTLDVEHLLNDPRYSTNDARVNNREALIPILEAKFMQRPRDHWLDELRKAGFPSAPVYMIDEIFEDPQVKHRGMLLEMEQPTAGIIKQIGAPIKFSKTPCEIRTPPPDLGEHTNEILKGIAGYTEKEIQALRNSRAI